MRKLKSDLEQIQFCWNSLISMHGRQLFNCEAKNITDLKAEHEIGFSEGRAEGRAQGAAEERAKAENEKREMAKGLHDDGVAMEIIVRRTGFSEEEIRAL